VKAEAEFKKAKETDIDRKVISEYNTAIREITGETKTPMVDLISLFESREGKDLFLDERHTSALAHAMIAEEIYNTLKTSHFIE
jgi:lysophospholipase L1-like esterase